MSAYRRFLAALEQVFFGMMEFAGLSSPAFVAVLVLQGRYPDASALAGLTAIACGSVAIGARIAEGRHRETPFIVALIELNGANRLDRICQIGPVGGGLGVRGLGRGGRC